MYYLQFGTCTFAQAIIQHGLTALGFFMGLLAGAIIAFLVVLIIVLLRRRGKCGGSGEDSSRSSKNKQAAAAMSVCHSILRLMYFI